jgi:DNA-binding transcriptional regulator YiaG
MRKALSLTQEEFAARFNIPLGTLRDWDKAQATLVRTCRPPANESKPL